MTDSAIIKAIAEAVNGTYLTRDGMALATFAAVTPLIRAAALEDERKEIAEQARRYAGHYKEGSDGRNTFIMLAEWIEARAAAPEQTAVMAEVAAERRRQTEAEGWTPEHDDEHSRGELARAAVCYADPFNEERENPPPKWPWEAKWWKPKDRRRDLVRAAALIVAEIDRLDRLRTTALSEENP